MGLLSTVMADETEETDQAEQAKQVRKQKKQVKMLLLFRWKQQMHYTQETWMKRHSNQAQSKMTNVEHLRYF